MALLPFSASLAATPSYLLIDGAGGGDLPHLSGCDREMAALHARLNQVPEDNDLLVAPTAATMRRRLLMFADHAPDAPRVLVFCGYGAASDGRLFALAADAPAQGNLGRTAVAAATFSRLFTGHDGAVMLDLYPAVQGGTVTEAVNAWRGDTSLGGYRLAQVETDAATAPLIARLTHASSFASDQLPMLAAVPPPAPAEVPPHESAAASPPIPEPGKPLDPAASVPRNAGSAGADTKASSAAIVSGATTTDDPGTAGTSPIVLAPPALPPSDLASSSVASSGLTPSGPPPSGLTPPGPASGEIPAKPADDVRQLHRSPMIRRIQVALLARGLFSGRVTGISNSATRWAIRHFQSSIGHPQTARLTPDELKLLTSG